MTQVRRTRREQHRGAFALMKAGDAKAWNRDFQRERTIGLCSADLPRTAMPAHYLPLLGSVGFLKRSDACDII